MTENAPIRILLVEDDPDYTALVRMHLDTCRSRMRFELEEAGTLREAAAVCGTRTPDVILLDLVLPDSRGIETLDAMLAWSGSAPIVVLTNLSVEDIGLEAIERGAQDFILKEKIEARELMRAIHFARERHRQRERLSMILRSVSDGVLVVDGDRRIRFANAAASRLLRIVPEKIMGTQFPFDLDAGERDLVLRDSSDKICSLRLGVVAIDWDGRAARLVTLHDVTELRRLAEARVEIREKRREEMRRDRFLSNLSHEMRSPLTVIDSVIKLLLRGQSGDVPPDLERFLVIAQRNSGRLVNIVKDLLDLSRLESGRAQVRMEAFPLDALIQDTVEDGAFMGDSESGVALEAKLPEELPLAYADKNMIGQVLHNLVGNGVRYAKSKVVVEAALNGAEIQISITDDGPGVPASERKRIFGRFEQVNRRPSGGYQGTGLGLPICREIIRVNAGRIKVDAAPGGGARFIFTVPTAGQTVPDRPAAGSGKAKGQRRNDEDD